MCLAVPGVIRSISAGAGEWLRTGRVDFGGVETEVNLACTPEARVGDYVLVHVGIAISTVDPAAAERTLQYLREIDALDGGPPDGAP